MDKQLDLLVIAPSSKDIYQELSHEFSSIEPNIWAGLLANAVRNVGLGVAIHDMSINPELDVDSYNPKLVLFVATGQNPSASSPAMQGAVEAAEQIDGKYKIAFVGPHVNALSVETLEKHPCIDFVFTNEGVYALINLLKSDLSLDTKGIVYRDGNEIVMNAPERVVPQELLEKDLPGVAFDLMPSLDNYRTSNWHANFIEEDMSPFASVYTSLGCIYQCSFCIINIINRTSNKVNPVSSDYNIFRYWNPDFIIKQFDYLASKGVKQIKIADEMWVLKPKHFMTLCDLLIERDYGFNIWAYTRIDTVKPKYLDRLKRAGVNWLSVGIESSNQDIRREITKGKFENINIREVVGMIQDAGINVCANYIYGLGSDTWDTIQETLNLALELNAENSNMYGAVALPGSPLYVSAKQNGWRLPERYSEFGFLSYDHICNRTDSLTAEEILAFRDYAFHVCFENPRYLSMIENKFGPKAVENIKKMTSIKLKRKILGH